MVNTELLRKFSFFEEISEPLLEEFAAHIKERHYKADCSIFLKGDTGDEIYFVVRGKLSVVLPLHRFDSRHRIVSEIEAGNFFGELSFFDGLERSANVRTKEDADILILTLWDFNRIIMDNMKEGCRIQNKIIARMVRIIRDMNETYSSAGFRL